MNERLDELKTLWAKEFDGSASEAESTRLGELMQDAALVEEFSDSKAAAAHAEGEMSLDGEQWAGVDKNVMAAWMRFKAPFWAKPIAWALAGAGVAAACMIWGTWQSSPASLPYSEDTLAVHRYQPPARPERVEARDEGSAPSLATAPISAPHIQHSHSAMPQREIKADAVSFEVEQPKRGPFSIQVKDSGGFVVRSLASGSQDKGSWHYGWDGLNDRGKAVLPGNYKIIIRTAAGETSREIEIRAKK